MRLLAALTALTLFVAPGCIPKQKYLDLETQAAATRAELEARIAALEKELADSQANAASLDAALSKAKARNDALDREISGLKKTIDDLQAEQARLLKDKAALKGSVEEMQAALKELERRKAAADRRIAQFQDMLDKFKKLIDAGTLRVKIVDGRMVVELATDILFASGSADLSDDGKKALEEVAAVLQSLPDRKYQVEGHTDNVPIKTAQYPSNWELASARALTVLKTMVSGGLAADRVSAASFGESKPAASNETKEGKAANRRIEIVVVPDLSELPGFDELKKMVGG
jgi:chemotaxis protein MotB